tara:strand:+ start:261 stop:464 length:204 start_codon:yes stop_codon:yes gene_type:complete
MSLGERMLKNIKRNPGMFAKAAAAGMKLGNPEKAGAAATGKDYKGSKAEMAKFRRIMKALGYDYGEE